MKSFVWRYRVLFAGAVLFVLGATVCAVAVQFLKGDVLDRALLGDGAATLQTGVLLLAGIVLELTLFHLYGRCAAGFEVRCEAALKKRVFESILARDYPAFIAEGPGVYLAKYTEKTGQVRRLYFAALPAFAEILTKIVLVSAALFVLCWPLALLTLALLTTPLYVPKLIEKRLQRAKKAHMDALERSLARVTDWLSGFEVIKNFQLEKMIADRFDRDNACAAQAQLHDERLGNLTRTISACISYLSYFAVLAAAAAFVVGGVFSAGDFFVSIGMIDQLSWPLIALSQLVRNLIGVKPVLSELESFLCQGRAHAKAPGPETFLREIRFENVGFSYDDQALLEGFCAVIQKGGKYLLRGGSGSGKTTLINLLLRYYAPQQGRIVLDGTPVDAYDDLYGIAAVVRQDPVLFDDTLLENLTLGQPVARPRLLAMLNAMGLSRFANDRALETPVGPGGAHLSGGERKRVCVLRALLRDKPLMILDEPLANLDDATAGALEDELLAICGKTVLIVSHQFSPQKLAAFDGVIDLKRAGADSPCA